MSCNHQALLPQVLLQQLANPALQHCYAAWYCLPSHCAAACLPFAACLPSFRSLAQYTLRGEKGAADGEGKWQQQQQQEGQQPEFIQKREAGAWSALKVASGLVVMHTA